MYKDFTIKLYIQLLKALQNNSFSFQTFSEFIENPEEKVIILRHDVDLLPENALETAQIENSLGIKGSYYFRIVPTSFNETIIKKIASLGHEIGYHYEDLNISKGNIDKAYNSFCENLKILQKLYPVKTICMHGSPLSKLDSRDIWNKYDYKKIGIIAEPYIDVDYSQVFYLTETGRIWNNKSSNVRDKVVSGFDIKIKSTRHIILMLNNNFLPNKIMLTIHPQRWSSNYYAWFKELIMQTIKNQIKRFYVK